MTFVTGYGTLRGFEVTCQPVSVVPTRRGLAMVLDASRLPRSVHERDDTHPAPEDLELVRAFLSLHDHERGTPDSLPPSHESVRWWLGSRGLVEPGDLAKDQDLAWALRVRDALTAKVRENMGEPRDGDAVEFLNRAAEETGLRVCFGCTEGEPIHVEATGVRGAIGGILGAVFLAELDGRWERFRVCHDPTCTAVFFDRSKNKSGKWCSMSACGNRAKVRAFRERQASG
jgi:CGNR zinc finger/Putative stress-induced transcription regulator